MTCLCVLSLNSSKLALQHVAERYPDVIVRLYHFMSSRMFRALFGQFPLKTNQFRICIDEVTYKKHKLFLKYIPSFVNPAFYLPFYFVSTLTDGI